MGNLWLNIAYHSTHIGRIYGVEVPLYVLVAGVVFANRYIYPHFLFYDQLSKCKLFNSA